MAAPTLPLISLITWSLFSAVQDIVPAVLHSVCDAACFAVLRVIRPPATISNCLKSAFPELEHAGSCPSPTSYLLRVKQSWPLVRGLRSILLQASRSITHGRTDQKAILGSHMLLVPKEDSPQISALITPLLKSPRHLPFNEAFLRPVQRSC